MTAITTVEAWTLAFPLRRPVVLPTMTFRQRDYCVVRLTDDEGRTGAAWCLGRDAPIAACVPTLGRLAAGTDPWHGAALWDRLYTASIPFGQRGIALRALSLIDVAAWDLRGRQAGVPVHALLGTARETVPVSVGGGYFREQRTSDDVAEELRGYVAAGYRHIKIPGGGDTPRAEAAWVAAAREAIGDDVELAVDAHWSWQDVPTARRVLREWEAADLAWVEDPLWPEASAAVAALHAQVSTPLAVGDELSGRWAYRDLLEPRAADIWRVDALCVGGFTEARRIAALASAYGIPLSPHVYPEVHVHLAAAEATMVAVEYTEPDQEIDMAHRFLDAPLRPRDGWVSVPTRPGLGVEVDWELVTASALDHHTVSVTDA